MWDDPDGLCDSFLNCSVGNLYPTGDDLDSLAEEVVGEAALGFVRGPRISNATSIEEALITAAWNILLSNMDLVVWAVCKATGSVSSSAFANLINRLNGKSGYRVEIRVIDIFGAGRIGALYGTNVIWVNHEWDVWENYLSMWSGGNDDERLCAAVNLAAVLLHETSHLAGYTYLDFWYSQLDICYESYMIGNAFGWAIHHRYPNSTKATCCLSNGGDWVYGCGNTTYPNLSGCGGSSGGGSGGGYFGGGGGDVLGLLWDLGLLAAGFGFSSVERGTIFTVETVGKLLDALWQLLFGHDDSSGGGCCSCECEECYSYCPGEWTHVQNGCCQLRDPISEVALECIAACTDISSTVIAEVESQGG